MASSILDPSASLKLQSHRKISLPTPFSSLRRQSRFDAVTWPVVPKFQPLRVGSRRSIAGSNRRLPVTRACAGDGGDRKGEVAVGEVVVGRFLKEAVSAIPPLPLPLTTKKNTGTTFTIGFLSLTFTILVLVARQVSVRNTKQSPQGSVADLVKRGQLRSGRRGISKPLIYEDPFNNPLVKSGKDNSTVEICGKVYHMAPVTLTGEQQSIHQKRRSRAYNWKRPSMFLKEGDDVPPDVDPDTIKWIPSNHPFATTVSDIDENMTKNNVHQKDGVPFRIRTEHEALQRKLEALQNEQKLDKIAITPNSFREIEQDMNNSVDEKHKHPSQTPKLDSSDDHSV